MSLILLLLGPEPLLILSADLKDSDRLTLYNDRFIKKNMKGKIHIFLFSLYHYFPLPSLIRIGALWAPSLLRIDCCSVFRNFSFSRSSSILISSKRLLDSNIWRRSSLSKINWINLLPKINILNPTNCFSDSSSFFIFSMSALSLLRQRSLDSFWKLIE